MTIFSLEVFPPKRTAPVGTIYDTLDGLTGLSPHFISVTYGTGKSAATLFPALKALGNGLTKQIFYLTARGTAQRAVSAS